MTWKDRELFGSGLRCDLKRDFRAGNGESGICPINGWHNATASFRFVFSKVDYRCAVSHAFIWVKVELLVLIPWGLISADKEIYHVNEEETCFSAISSH